MLQSTLSVSSVLFSALLFGGMTLFAFGFAAFLFSAIPVPEARLLIRKAFPHFYLFVMGSAALAAVLTWRSDATSALVLAAIALTTVPTRQMLMPAINAATDAGDRRTFGRLHGLSVVITLIHIAAAGAVLARFVL
ncbi:MAG: DUF4149 domain-containing protein [Hydrogenophaga sp.]|jgi:ABC-type transport system involved in multi-copper enzyme maturation permease subunit|nr:MULTISPECIES: DUF4149 domain-containing protein [Pseudomonadota]MDO9132420.1 DUF4149 domain-containing protein [Hydrogenophaga sp.]MDO9505318.1 DUF4149 domain-containing protein [Hydrogenophaga sp.]MDP1780769.1 DUF4149 domain-containing protein [Hydrogenophaga sp.]MDP2075415.1 DUF4149 domain-containing protein [Hydrogenophaga sp.]MDP2251585.1 DUF4149 domain-containing protein [Hydrogenophaga sp.]